MADSVSEYATLVTTSPSFLHSIAPFTVPAVLHCVLLYSLLSSIVLADTKFCSPSISLSVNSIVDHCADSASTPCSRDPAATYTPPTTSPVPAPLSITISPSARSSPPSHRDNPIVDNIVRLRAFFVGKPAIISTASLILGYIFLRHLYQAQHLLLSQA